MDARPIGVFDSGLGGLTAVKQLEKVLPGESIVYFGDTGRVPYGSRGKDTILRYARQDMEFLLSQNVKAVLAACGARVNRDQQVHYLYPGDSAYVAACEENAALPCVLLGTNDMTQNTLELAAFERVYMLNADDAQGVAPALEALDEKPDGFILFERYHDEANVETVLRETGLESAELLFEHQYHVYWVH